MLREPRRIFNAFASIFIWLLSHTTLISYWGSWCAQHTSWILWKQNERPANSQSSTHTDTTHTRNTTSLAKLINIPQLRFIYFFLLFWNILMETRIVGIRFSVASIHWLTSRCNVMLFLLLLPTWNFSNAFTSYCSPSIVALVCMPMYVCVCRLLIPYRLGSIATRSLL